MIHDRVGGCPLALLRGVPSPPGTIHETVPETIPYPVPCKTLCTLEKATAVHPVLPIYFIRAFAHGTAIGC